LIDRKRAPYLEAVIFEGLRIRSVANFPSEREGGAQFPSGTCLPPGAYVSINPAAMNRRQEIYGTHPDLFDPMRWLQGNELLAFLDFADTISRH
jgi:cytochrome P450